MALKRKEIILKYIVEDFVKTCEPVGSKILLKRHKLPYSSATVRNDMMELELDGYIRKTHIASGRIPSTEGYRYYVSNLRNEKVDKTIRYEVDRMFDNSKSVEDLINESCELLSHMTNLAVCFLGPSLIDEKVASLQAIPLTENRFAVIFLTDKGYCENKSFILNKNTNMNTITKTFEIINSKIHGTRLLNIVDKLAIIKNDLNKFNDVLPYINELLMAILKDFMLKRNGNFYGKENLLDQPEFKDDIEEVKSLFEILSNPYKLSQMFTGSTETTISIGNGAMKDITIITKDIRVPSTNQELGKIAIVGPTRMDYEMVLKYLDYVVDMIMHHLNDIKEKEYGRRNERNKI